MRKYDFGLFFVSLYLLITIIVIFLIQYCNDVYCEYIIFAPLLPWSMIFKLSIFTSYFTYSAFVVLNCIILYLIGAFLTEPLDQKEK